MPGKRWLETLKALELTGLVVLLAVVAYSKVILVLTLLVDMMVATPKMVFSPNQKAKHTLSNGEEIWNMAGNVLEWVKDQNIDPNPPPPQGTNFGVSWAGVIPRENVYKDQFTLNVDGVLKTRHYRDHFGPQGDYSHMANHSNHYLTIGLVDLPRFKSAFYRGTYFWASRGEGVFSISGTTPDLHALWATLVFAVCGRGTAMVTTPTGF